MNDDDLKIPMSKLARLRLLHDYSDAGFRDIPTSQEPLAEMELQPCTGTVRKSFSFPLRDGGHAFVVCDLDDTRLRVTWSGTPLEGGRRLWLAIWDDSSREPKKWFELGFVGPEQASLDILRPLLGPLEGRRWQISAIPSKP